ncbi:hypothetical protein EGW08_018061 [Elysia chlorotica]|uniref:BTB domain-containing protein n=1 Tax=Elysia chlorotica TaxID=188477 RepID=A0A433SY12_ELYCH|nr:hypothetical protein EGW08_018061 [Elysia chlorotica]
MDDSVEGLGFAFTHLLPSHGAKLLECLNRQWMDCKFCDLLLLVQGEAIYVHSCILSAFCPTVAEILMSGSGQKEEVSGEMWLKEEGEPASETQRFGDVDRTVVLDFSCEVVRCVLSAFYTGVLKPRAEILSELLAAAEWLRARELVAAIKQHSADPSPERRSLRQTLAKKNRQEFENAKGKLAQPDAYSKVPGINLDDKSDQDLDGQDTLPLEMNVYSKESEGLIKIDCATAELPLSLAETKPCYVQIEDCPEIKDSVKKTNKVKSKKLKVALRYSTSAPEKYKPCCDLAAKAGNCDCKTSWNVMVATLLKDTKVVKQRSQKKTFTKPASLAIQDLDKRLKKSRKKKTEASTADENNQNLIEEMEEGDPMKQELDFLVGSIGHLKCRMCHLKFTDLDLYHNHVNDHPTFNCKECGMKFMRKFNLTRHVRYNHEGAPHLTCKLCPPEFDDDGQTKAPFKAHTEVEFRRHSREVHGVERPFPCEHEGCEYRARKFERLVRHREIHNSEHLYVCEKCGQGFSQQNGLNSHLRACYQLQQFLCDLCGQSFNHAQSMRLHRSSVHFGEKRFKCSVCSNSFSDHRNLSRHMRIHDNSFPYACPVCRQKYRHSNSLKAHMAAKHKDLPPEQLQMPTLQSRNKLGGSSFKRRTSRRSRNTQGRAGAAVPGREELLSLGFMSNGVKAGRQGKAKGGDSAPGESSLSQPQGQELFQDHEPRHIHLGGLSGDWHLQVSDQSGFEVHASDLDIIMDPNTGRATLQVKSSTSSEQREAAVLSGEQILPAESLREYAAFLEKQTSLYGVYPGPVSERHPLQIQGDVDVTATTQRQAESGQLNQHHVPSLSPHHQESPMSSYFAGGTENPAVKNLSSVSVSPQTTTTTSSSPSCSTPATTTLPPFPGVTAGNAPQDALSFQIYTYNGVCGVPVVEVGSMIGCGGQGLRQQSPGSWYSIPQEEAANLSKDDAGASSGSGHPGRSGTTNSSSAQAINRPSPAQSSPSTEGICLGGLGQNGDDFRRHTASSSSSSLLTSSLRKNLSPERLRLPHHHQPPPHPLSHNHQQQQHYQQHQHHQQQQQPHPGENLISHQL